MMKNFENKVVFLNQSGAKRMFSNPDVIGLPVIPTDPTMVGDTIVYGDTFMFINGEYIGGCISQDAFSEESPDDLIPVLEAYAKHIEMLSERFGPQERRCANTEELMAKPQVERIPTLDERAKRRDNGEAW